MRAWIACGYLLHALLALGLATAVLQRSLVTGLAVITSAAALYGLRFFIWYAHARPKRLGLAGPRLALEKLDRFGQGARRKAANSLRGIGPDAISLLPMLVERLQNEDPVVRHYLLLSIGRLGSEAEAAADALIKGCHLGPSFALARFHAAVRVAFPASKPVDHRESPFDAATNLTTLFDSSPSGSFDQDFCDRCDDSRRLRPAGAFKVVAAE